MCSRQCGEWRYCMACYFLYSRCAPSHMTEISHFFNVCIVAGPGFASMLKAITSLWWESSLLVTVRNFKNHHPQMFSSYCRGYWISVIDDRSLNQMILCQKEFVGSYEWETQSGSTHFRYTLMLHRHSSDPPLLSSVLLLCSQTAPLSCFWWLLYQIQTFSTTSPGGKNEIPSSRIFRKVPLHCWFWMVLNRLREAPDPITVAQGMRDAG